MEYWNIVIGIQPNTPAFHHSVHSPLSSTLICVIAISPAATEHIIERTGSAAYTSTNGSAFADIGMRRGADSRARCPANCRASQSSQPAATKLKSEIPRYHARICLFFIGLTSYQDVFRKTRSNTPRRAKKKPMEKFVLWDA